MELTLRISIFFLTCAGNGLRQSRDYIYTPRVIGEGRHCDQSAIPLFSVIAACKVQALSLVVYDSLDVGKEVLHFIHLLIYFIVLYVMKIKMRQSNQ